MAGVTRRRRPSATRSADIVRDGHEVLRAVLRWRRPGTTRWQEAPMRHVDAASAGVRWVADLAVDEVGPWSWTVRAWVDPVASWLAELGRKVAFGQEDFLTATIGDPKYYKVCKPVFI